MSIGKWLQGNTHSLAGKTVAITGSTGGLGRALCRHLAGLGASLLLLDRNPARQAALREELIREFPKLDIQLLQVDLEQMQSVRTLCTELKARQIDIFIHNAGAYAIPRHRCDTGFDNVFQINFLSPYYIIRELLPQLRARHGHVVAVGSIAHKCRKSDPQDLDFSTRKRDMHVYGNAKRYLIYALFALFERERQVTLSVAHPGICQTGITSHYPRVIRMLVKYPMRLIFMRPKKASLPTLYGVFCPCRGREWIGPRVLDIWGLPRKKRLSSAPPEEAARMASVAEEIYLSIKA